MVLHISDEVLRQAGLSERDVLTELACRLFQAERLTLWQAAQLACISRTEMEDELHARRIPVYHVTAETLAQDLESLRRMGT